MASTWYKNVAKYFPFCGMLLGCLTEELDGGGDTEGLVNWKLFSPLLTLNGDRICSNSESEMPPHARSSSFQVPTSSTFAILFTAPESRQGPFICQLGHSLVVKILKSDRFLLARACDALGYMELSLEAYRNIVKFLGNRADIAALCRVSKGFQYACERALYNTLYLRDIRDTISLCTTLAGQPRLAVLVDALTLSLSDDDSDSEDDSEESHSYAEPPPLPDVYWPLIASALQKTTRLRYLNIHIHINTNKAVAWILDNCTFRLRRFHCDLDWDLHLVEFLNTQADLDDLYIIDYNENASITPTTNAPSPALLLKSDSIPNLKTLECTFSEAAVAIVPGRPITHLKTCFSRSEPSEKQEEMARLFSKIKLSTQPLHALDIADSTYSEAFSADLLSCIVDTQKTASNVRYVGTLVLPILGNERLHFYGLLMRLPHVQCVEVEVSEWVPAPTSPAAFRALASEMRLYAPSVTCVVFVNNFDRTVVTAINGICRVEGDINTDSLWREV